MVKDIGAGSLGFDYRAGRTRRGVANDLPGVATVVTFKHAVFSIVVSRVSTYIALSLFPFFCPSRLCVREIYYFMVEK